MRLLHGNEMHFVRCPDGRVYSRDVSTYSLWKEYLGVFDEVLVVARVRTVNEIHPAEQLADGQGVSFHDLPDFHGPESYLWHTHAVQSGIQEAIRSTDACIFRVPGTIGYLGAREALRQHRDYAYEVVGDPYDVFSAGSVYHPLRAYFQQWHTRNLRRFCASACAATYVTEHALQRRYPPNPLGYTTYFSDVMLKPDFFVPSSRNVRPISGPHRLLSVGSLEQLYKAPDILIKALAECLKQGLDLRLIFAGEGAMRGMLEQLAFKLGVSDAVHFAGQVVGREALAKLLDETDLFILPSRAEGLPRAMLEAMARAVPCIGSTVNGIPELLAPEDLVAPNDVSGLAGKIAEVLIDPARLSRMSARGLKKAHEFESERMRARKLEFLRHVRDVSDRNPVPAISRRALTV